MTASPHRSSRFLPIVVDMSLFLSRLSLPAAGLVQVEQASSRGMATELHACCLSLRLVSVPSIFVSSSDGVIYALGRKEAVSFPHSGDHVAYQHFLVKDFGFDSFER